MNRLALYPALLVILAIPCVVWAQVDSGPQLTPAAAGPISPAAAGALPPPPPPGLPGPGSLAPAGEQSWPPPVASPPEQIPPPAAWPAAPAAYQPPPAAYQPPPGQPVQVVQPAGVWVAPPRRAVFVPWDEPCIVPAAPPGRWDVVLEALWLTRSAGSGTPLGFTSYNFDSHLPPAVRTRHLHTDDDAFPLQTGLRLQVARRISDRAAIEATYWGLQHWSVGRTILGDPVGESVLAFSPWLQGPDLVGGFDNYLAYDYASDVHNVEINERIRINTLNPYSQFTWLWGVRYFHLSDDFTLSGSDLWSDSYEILNYQTRNNLLGMQAGLQWVWGGSRFQLNTELKVGFFANFYDQQGSAAGWGAPGFVPWASSHSGADLSVLVELSLTARYRLNDDLWLRLGYQFYAVSGLALGPRQLAGYDAGGAVGLDGLSLGLEWAW